MSYEALLTIAVREVVVDGAVSAETLAIAASRGFSPDTLEADAEIAADQVTPFLPND